MRKEFKRWKLDYPVVRIDDEPTRTFLTERVWLDPPKHRSNKREDPRATRMLNKVGAVLTFCKGLERNFIEGPRASYQAKALGDLLAKERRLEKAVEKLDIFTWRELFISGEVDHAKCPVPDSFVNGPAIPIALKELRRAAEALRAQKQSRRTRDQGPRRSALQDVAVELLAICFQHHATSDLQRDHKAYADELTAFVRRALAAAKFKIRHARRFKGRAGLPGRNIRIKIPDHLQVPAERSQIKAAAAVGDESANRFIQGYLERFLDGNSLSRTPSDANAGRILYDRLVVPRVRKRHGQQETSTA